MLLGSYKLEAMFATNFTSKKNLHQRRFHSCQLILLLDFALHLVIDAVDDLCDFFLLFDRGQTDLILVDQFLSDERLALAGVCGNTA